MAKIQRKTSIRGSKAFYYSNSKKLPTFFLTFEKAPFLPKISKKGNGRKKGSLIKKKQTYKPVKKQNIVKKIKEKCQQNC
jgi:hypothetical protein